MVLQKADQFKMNPGDRAVFSFSDIAAEAQVIVDEAREQAAGIVEEARVDAIRIRQESKEEGFAEGHLAGMAEGKKAGYEQSLEENRELFGSQSQDMQRLLQDMLHKLEKSKQAILWQAEQDTVRLAVAIADKVTKQTANRNCDVAVENVKSALALVTQATDVVVRLNENDVQHLTKLADSPDNIFGKYERIRFEEDNAIEAGGCVLASESGSVDGQLPNQIDRIVKELLIDSSSEGSE
jgi:flagellar assembly protein FliH